MKKIIGIIMIIISVLVIICLSLYVIIPIIYSLIAGGIDLTQDQGITVLTLTISSIVLLISIGLFYFGIKMQK